MKEIVILSGKGGTGKTSLTAAFAMLGKGNVAMGDCDVDAADMHLLLAPDFAQSTDFYSGGLAVIDEAACVQCGDCEAVCRFDAFYVEDGSYRVNPLNCEGCGYCAHVCPTDAIRMEEQKTGQWYISNTKTGDTLVHARLGIGAENSGKLVAEVKKHARRLAGEQNRNFVLIDGSPGVGCPVISSLSGADFVVLVTEPTVSGLHDLRRVYQLVRKFQLPAACIINKADLYPAKADEIREFLKAKNILHLASIPYDEDFTKSMTNGRTIVETPSALAQEITQTWETLIHNLD